MGINVFISALKMLLHNVPHHETLEAIHKLDRSLKVYLKGLFRYQKDSRHPIHPQVVRSHSASHLSEYQLLSYIFSVLF